MFYIEFLAEIGSQSANLEHMLLGMKGYDLGLTAGDRNIKRKIDLLIAIGK